MSEKLQSRIAEQLLCVNRMLVNSMAESQLLITGHGDQARAGSVLALLEQERRELECLRISLEQYFASA